MADVKGKMERGELIPDPDWQRGYIWKQKDEQLLIDSILKGIPIPSFYLTEEYDAQKGASIHFAVDGQQRLTAICKFLSNEFPVEINDKNYYFRDLDGATQKKITTYKLHGHYMTNHTQGDINFLFQRINRTGIKLTNMEEWNNSYFDNNILKMINEIYRDAKGFHVDVIYTEENIKRKLPLDDIIDLCNCLENNSIEGGSKKELEAFLKRHKDISPRESAVFQSKFKRTIANIKQLFSKQDLESSAYSKRTHFISLFLAVAQLISNHYILPNTGALKKDLLDFLENQPTEYKESVLGAIRKKLERGKRVNFFQEVILKYGIKLDEKRLHDAELKQRLWRQYRQACQICKKEIINYNLHSALGEGCFSDFLFLTKSAFTSS